MENTQSGTSNKILKEQFRATFEQAAVGIAHISPRGEFIRINQKFCDIVGFTMEEMLGNTFQEITHPEDLDRDVSQVNKLLQGSISTYSMEKRYFRKDKKIVWVNLTVSLVRDQDGEPDYFVSVIEDISDRKQAEEELRKSEEKFRGIFETLSDVFTRSDMDGVCTLVSPSIYDLLGYRPEEVLGKDLAMLYVDPLQRAGIMKRLQGSREVQNFEVEALKKDGTKILVSLNAKIYYDTNGEPLGVEGNTRDITWQKQAESEHNKLFNYSFDLLCIAGLDGYFKEVNPSWEKATGYSITELTSRPFIEFIHPEDRERTILEVEKLSKGTPTLDFENRYLKKDGEILYLSWTAIFEEEGNLLYCSARDVTARQEAKQQLLNYQQRLRDLARELTITEEKVKKQIAVDLHDNVGQMLSSIRMQLARIEAMEENKEIRLRINNISHSLKTAIQSTRDAIFNLSLPQLSEIGLQAAVEDWARSEVVNKYDLTFNISGNIDNDLIPEEMRMLLFRSIKELINNVLKHAGARTIIINLEQDGDGLEISVEDDGIGFDYNPMFLSLKSNAYGLFTIQERVSDLGGSLQVDSEPGRGTKVAITIPIMH